MRVKVGDKIYDGEIEPVMVILSEGEKEHISKMAKGSKHYCVYPSIPEWTDNDHEAIKKWMRDY